NTYLRADPASPWAAEARSHKSQIEEKLRQFGLDSPRTGGSYIGERMPAARIESDLLDAIRRDLPSLAIGAPSVELRNLALVLRAEHGDDWLSDVLSALPRSVPEFAAFHEAAQLLSDAIDADSGRDLALGQA